MNQQRNYLSGVGRIGKTHQILDQLQQKMIGYHERKRTEEQLLQSREQPSQPIKTKSNFKLFTRPQSQANTQKMQLQQLQAQNSKGKRQGQVGQLLEEVEAIELLARKKLALKEQIVAQLQRQVQLAGEQKLHLYKINCQLQEQLAALGQQEVQKHKKIQYQQSELEAELMTLQQIEENKRNENKRLKKEEQLLRETLKEAHSRRKSYHESEIKVIKNQSKSKFTQKHTETLQQEQYLRNLVGELDKLKRMVKEKMKKSVSKRKIR